MIEYIKLVLFFVVMCIFTFLLGNVLYKKNGVIEKIVLGFCIMLAITQVFCVPMTYANGSFYGLLIVVLASIAFLSAISIVKLKKNWDYSVVSNIKNNTVFLLKKPEELVLLLVFVSLFCFQLYTVLFYQLNYMSFDDTTYVANSLGMLENNNLLTNYDFNNNYTMIYPKYAVTSIMPFEAILSKVFDVNVAAMVHSFFPTFLLFLQYGVFYLISKELFKQKTNRYLFLIVISILVIFGYFSIYSPSMRIIGVMWHGKSIFLSIVSTTILWVVLNKFRKKEFFNTCLLLLVLSTAACACTSTAAIMVMLEIFSFSLVFLIWKRKKRFILYTAAGFVMPLMYSAVLVLTR